MAKKSLVDSVLKTCRIKINKEVTALLGQPVKCGAQKNGFTSKEEFFSKRKKKQIVVSTLDVTGEMEGKSYIVTNNETAIVLGATLLMLPEQEIRSRATRGSFDEEEADAFGEIANIIAGILAATFGESYSQKLHFARTEVIAVEGASVDMASDKPFAEDNYYLSSCTLNVGDNELDELHLLFPVSLLNIDQEDAAAKEDGAKEAGGKQQVLIVTDFPEMARPIADTLKEHDFAPRVVNSQTNVKNLMLEHPIHGMFILLKEVNDKGLAGVVKVLSALGPEDHLPFIVCGPKWTQRQVLQAVKYGASDILVVPATQTEIAEKIKENMPQHEKEMAV